VKIDEKIDYHPNLNSKTSFSLIFMQDLGNGWAETIGQGLHYSSMTKKKAGGCFNIGNLERQKILDTAEHHH
jgi:hypothetical protein